MGFQQRMEVIFHDEGVSFYYARATVTRRTGILSRRKGVIGLPRGACSKCGLDTYWLGGYEGHVSEREGAHDRGRGGTA
jgi:hypothetical protein